MPKRASHWKRCGPEDIVDALEHTPWLLAQPGDVRAEILRNGRPQTLRTGQSLYSAGDEPGGIYGVVAGGILLSIEGNDRSMRPAHIARRGTWFGHGPLMTRRRRMLGAEASEPTIIAQVPLCVLERMIATDPMIARSIGSISDFTQDVVIACISDLLIPDATRRIGAVLLRVTGALDGVVPDDPRGFLLTQTLIGDLANASRPSVNRALAEFTERAWVHWAYRRAIIRDTDALARFTRGETIEGGRRQDPDLRRASSP